MDNREKMKIGGAVALLLIGLILVVINLLPSKPKIADEGAPAPASGGARRGAIQQPDRVPPVPPG